MTYFLYIKMIKILFDLITATENVLVCLQANSLSMIRLLPSFITTGKYYVASHLIIILQLV